MVDGGEITSRRHLAAEAERAQFGKPDCLVRPPAHTVTPMSAANQLPTAMTAAEFLAWNPQDSDRWELVDGTPRARLAS
jgi:hypothetical protein